MRSRSCILIHFFILVVEFNINIALVVIFITLVVSIALEVDYYNSG